MQVEKIHMCQKLEEDQRKRTKT